MDKFNKWTLCLGVTPRIIRNLFFFVIYNLAILVVKLYFLWLCPPDYIYLSSQYNMLENSQFIYLVFFVVLMVAVLQDISSVNLNIHYKKFTVNFFGSIEFSHKSHRCLLFKGN